MQRFIAPKSIEELCLSLKEKDNNTYIISGGTDLLIHFSKKGIFDFDVIDITKISELKEITETETEISIGACVTMTELEDSTLIKQYVPALADAAYSLGSQQIRNLATIGGNTANSSQSGDTLPVLFAYGAQAEIINSAGIRRIDKVESIVAGLEKNNLSADEAITKIIIKKDCRKSAFSKIGSRKAVTISKINCCAVVDLNNDSIIENAVIYLGAVGPKPVRGSIIEQALIGMSIDNFNISEIKEAVYSQIESLIPDRSSKHYKKSAAVGLVEDVLNKLRS